MQASSQLQCARWATGVHHLLPAPCLVSKYRLGCWLALPSSCHWNISCTAVSCTNGAVKRSRPHLVKFVVDLAVHPCACCMVQHAGVLRLDPRHRCTCCQQECDKRLHSWLDDGCLWHKQDITCDAEEQQPAHHVNVQPGHSRGASERDKTDSGDMCCRGRAGHPGHPGRGDVNRYIHPQRTQSLPVAACGHGRRRLAQAHYDADRRSSRGCNVLCSHGGHRQQHCCAHEQRSRQQQASAHRRLAGMAGLHCTCRMVCMTEGYVSDHITAALKVLGRSASSLGISHPPLPHAGMPMLHHQYVAHMHMHHLRNMRLPPALVYMTLRHSMKHATASVACDRSWPH